MYTEAKQILEAVQNGEMTADEALLKLKTEPFEDIGYGASFGGLSALLSMLNSCACGVSVVNIDNGFGAGCLANMINHTVGHK